MRLRKTSTQVMADSHSPTLPKKKVSCISCTSTTLPLLRAGKALPLPPSSSPTTLAIRIAHQKRALYTQCGAHSTSTRVGSSGHAIHGRGDRVRHHCPPSRTYKDETGVCLPQQTRRRPGCAFAVAPVKIMEMTRVSSRWQFAL